MKHKQPQTNPVEPTWNENDPMGSFRRHADHLHQKAKHLFLEHGRHIEIMIFFYDDGNTMPLPVPATGDRDRVSTVIRGALKGSRVIGVVHICEAWTRMSPPGDHIAKQLMMGEMNVSDLHPQDRGEALFTSIQSSDGQTICKVDAILRGPTGKPRFGKGFEMGEMGGRFGRLFG